MATNESFNKTARTPKKTKKFTWKKGLGIFVGLIVLIFAFMWFFPYYGTIKYGICRTYIELNEPYPQSIQFVDAYEDAYYNQVTISYKKTDPFGLEALNEMVCLFDVKEDGSILLKSVDINGKKRKYPQEAPELIEKFNRTIPAIRAYPPNLIMPYLISTDIKDYR